MTQDRSLFRLLQLTCITLFSSCSYMSQPGPKKEDIVDEKQANYQLIEVKSRADLPTVKRGYGMGQIPPTVKGGSYSDKVRTRDTLTFVITDLTQTSPFYAAAGGYNFGPLEVPEDGVITFPYVGDLQVMNQSLSGIATDLNQKLKPISSTAQATVGRASRIPRTANVIGEVRTPGPIPLERSNISSLDLLAASGGPNLAEHLFKYTLRRGGQDYTFDYQGFRKMSFPVEEGDLLSVSTEDSNRFYVMGAINKPTIVPFPVSSPTLADALAAATGFDETRSDPSGVFIFRKGNPDLVYTLNLKDPQAVFLTQRFPIRGEDLVYVTEAPLTRWNRLISQLMPFSQISQAAYNVDRIAR